MKLTNKQLRQIIKEELEAVLNEANEALPLDTILAQARVMDPDLLQTMPELKDLAQGEDMRYHSIVSSHGARGRVASIFAKVNGKVYEVANKQPIEQTSLIEDDLIANGFKDEGAMNMTSRPRGAFYGGADGAAKY